MTRLVLYRCSMVVSLLILVPLALFTHGAFRVFFAVASIAVVAYALVKPLDPLTISIVDFIEDVIDGDYTSPAD